MLSIQDGIDKLTHNSRSRDTKFLQYQTSYVRVGVFMGGQRFQHKPLDGHRRPPTKDEKSEGLVAKTHFYLAEHVRMILAFFGPFSTGCVCLQFDSASATSSYLLKTNGRRRDSSRNTFSCQRCTHVVETESN